MTDTKVPIELSSTPGIIDNSTATAITIDSAGAATFSGTVTADGLNVEGDINLTEPSPTITFTDTSDSSVHLVQSINTALNIQGQSQVRLSTAATERVRVNSNGDISFYEDTGTTAKFFWDASAESLGIGTSSPSHPLTIQGSGTSGNAVKIVGDSTNNTGRILWRNSADSSETGRISVDGSSNLTVHTGSGGAERLRIDSAGAATFSGNVGIGVTPSASWTGSVALQIGTKGSFSNSSSFTGLATNTVATSSGWATKYITDGAASVYLQATSDGSHRFYTAPVGTAGATSTITEHMRLDPSGNLLVGTTNSSVAAGEGIKLRNGFADKGVALVSTQSTNAAEGFTMWSTGVNTWRFYVGWNGKVNATSNTIQAISDQRFKENIRDLDDGLSKVMELRPRKFDWKEGKGADIKDARGFIAQEFEEIFPDLVGEWKDEAPEGEEPYKAVSQDLIPTLVKAIQEQQAIIEALTARIEALEGA